MSWTNIILGWVAWKYLFDKPASSTPPADPKGMVEIGNAIIGRTAIQRELAPDPLGEKK